MEKKEDFSVRLILLAALVLLFALISCGRRGGPKPPEDFAPSPVKFLAATGKVDGVVLTWQAPDTMANGDSLIDLAGFKVKRSLYEKDEAPDFEKIGLVPVAPEATAEGEAAPTPTPTPAPLFSTPASAKKAPQQFSFTDTTVAAGSRYEYEVIPYNADGVDGLPSGIIRVTFTGESSYFETFASPEKSVESIGNEEVY